MEDADDIAVAVSAGSLDGVVRWDVEIGSYVAELALFGHPRRGVRDRHHVVRDTSVIWCYETFDAYLPTKLVIGHRRAEFVTTDALANHLACRGLALCPLSRHRLVELRHHVEDRWGDVVIIGRPTLMGPGPPSPPTDGQRFRLWLEPPGGPALEIVPRRADPGYAFDCGAPTPGTLETARTIVELTYSAARGRQEELLAVELATTALVSAYSGFELLAGSVADWIVTDVPLLFRSTALRSPSAAPPSRFRQLALGFP